jgi:hypothetical protein
MSLQMQTPARRVPLSAARIAPERRRYKRFKMQLSGRYMRADKTEHDCKVTDISPGGLSVETAVRVTAGERIIAQFEHVGGLTGTVVRAFPGGFVMTLTATRYKREKLAAQITWLINRHELAEQGSDRQHERFPVKNRVTSLRVGDDHVIECRILDVSLSGASLGTAARPPVGELVHVGKQRARVMRYHDLGIGVQFLDQQEREDLQRDFG